MDYMFLTEDVEMKTGEEGEGDTSTVRESMTVLVMQESVCRSVWAYAVENKGAVK